MHVASGIDIDEGELSERFVRSAGPGGQNVNKVATAVQLRFDVAHSPSLPEGVRRRLTRLAGRRLNKDGVLVIEAKRFRTQEKNRADARKRLAALVARAAEPPPPPRKKTRPSRAAKARRVEAKRKHKQIKRLRKPPKLTE